MDFFVSPARQDRARPRLRRPESLRTGDLSRLAGVAERRRGLAQRLLRPLHGLDDRRAHVLGWGALERAVEVLERLLGLLLPLVDDPEVEERERVVRVA